MSTRRSELELMQRRILRSATTSLHKKFAIAFSDSSLAQLSPCCEIKWTGVVRSLYLMSQNRNAFTSLQHGLRKILMTVRSAKRLSPIICYIPARHPPPVEKHRLRTRTMGSLNRRLLRSQMLAWKGFSCELLRRFCNLDGPVVILPSACGSPPLDTQIVSPTVTRSRRVARPVRRLDSQFHALCSTRSCALLNPQ
jgi:hypothetical protein